MSHLVTAPGPCLSPEKSRFSKSRFSSQALIRSWPAVKRGGRRCEQHRMVADPRPAEPRCLWERPMTPGNSQRAGEDPATGHLPEEQYDPHHLAPFQPKWCRTAQDWLLYTGKKEDCEHVHMHTYLFLLYKDIRQCKERICRENVQLKERQGSIRDFVPQSSLFGVKRECSLTIV